MSVKENKEYLYTAEKIFRNIGDLAQDTLSDELVDIFTPTIHSLKDSYYVYFLPTWYFFQNMERITEKHVTLYNYYFSANLNINELRKNINEFGSDNLLNKITADMELYTKLEIEITSITNGEFEKFTLSSVLINCFKKISEDFVSINFDEELVQIQKKILEGLYRTIAIVYKNAEQNGGSVSATHYSEKQLELTHEQEEEILTFEELLNELNKLVGMEQLKQDINSVINLIRVQKMRLESGLPTPHMSMHLVFTGNPGTGKTTVARLLSRIYRSLGILSKGHIVEVDRAGLVAGYVGQTSLKTDDIITQAIGGILFIDEAYTLATDDYGREAIETLLKRMEDLRSELIVIVAGYPHKMAEFLNSNPGLESRFNKYIQFEDYTAEELNLIFELMCNEAGYKLTPQANVYIKEYLKEVYLQKDTNFGNAREVRNIFEKILSNHANRIVNIPNISKKELTTIHRVDIPGGEEKEKISTPNSSLWNIWNPQ